MIQKIFNKKAISKYVDLEGAAPKLARFLVSGLLNTAIFCLILMAILNIFSINSYMTNYIISFVLSLPVCYLSHRIYSFQYRGAHRGAVGRFLFTMSVAFVMGLVAVFVGKNALQLPDPIVTAMVIVTIPGCTFLAMLFWVFAHRRGAGAAD